MNQADVTVGRVYRGKTGSPRRVVEMGRTGRGFPAVGYSRPGYREHVLWMTRAAFASWAIYEIPAYPTDKDPANG